MGEKQSKGYWQEDEDAAACNGCGRVFSTTVRRHHCRNCGYVFCGDCSRHRSTIPMRGITDPERVCDACYLALRNSNMAGSSLSRGGPGSITNPSETPDRLPIAAAGGGGPSGDASAPGAGSGVGGAVPPVGGAAPEMTEEQRRAEEYYKNLYGGDAGGGPGDEDDAAVSADREEAMGPEALERERLIQRWNMVRQATVYVDILVQQSERVELDTAVEYSRETEALTLLPEMPLHDLAVSLLPLPCPSTDSVRYLVESVATLGVPSSTLERVTADLAQRLATRPPVSASAHRLADDFVGY
ncbi:zinc finger protein [Novymonas esmeraldas]|uniref:Zinc finger protein n=1 Tax=Novymonas esmeraldas TaxID=1808958 RepID=A0AAW0F7U4_9TRYP